MYFHGTCPEIANNSHDSTKCFSALPVLAPEHLMYSSSVVDPNTLNLDPDPGSFWIQIQYGSGSATLYSRLGQIVSKIGKWKICGEVIPKNLYKKLFFYFLHKWLANLHGFVNICFYKVAKKLIFNVPLVVQISIFGKLQKCRKVLKTLKLWKTMVIFEFRTLKLVYNSKWTFAKI